MQFKTQYGTFVGSEEDYKLFLSVKNGKAEKPSQSPQYATEEKPKKTVRKTK